MLEVLLHEQISIYCKYYFSLNHLSRTMHHIFILLFHVFGCLNPDLALKAENPIEKHLADSNLFDYTKILTVAGVGMPASSVRQRISICTRGICVQSILTLAMMLSSFLTD